jgi:hypothetical protein
MLRGLAQVVRVERTQKWVARHPEIEPVHKVDEEGFSPDPVEQRVHGVESRGLRMHADSRP